MALLRRTGYRSENLLSDISLGLLDGLDMSLWCYVFASIIYIGALSAYLPVGILTLLLGWVLVSIWVTLTSREPLHVCNPDDQAVVIFGSVAALIVNALGDEAGTPAGLATILFIIASTTLSFAVGCHLAARYRFSRMLELMPFPVVCGFMAAIGWLLLDAGLEVMAGVSLSPDLVPDLAESGRTTHLVLSLLLGVLMLRLSYWLNKSWTLPAASTAVVLLYYLTVSAIGMPMSEQAANGWLFVVADSEGGALDMLGSLSFSNIDWRLVAGALPLMLTVVFLALLYASMTMTALKADSEKKLSLADEFNNLAAGNLLSAAVACPQAITDVVASSMYRKFGATSRWMPLTSSFVGIVIIVFGAAIVGYLPKLLVGATIFLFVLRTFYEWLYLNLRDFGVMDYLIVWIIFGTAIMFGFMSGILVGIILTVLLFVLRYSLISAIQSRHTLREQHSSVERSATGKRVLRRDGETVVIYRLRGFLFFGTANTILDAIVENEQLDGDCQALLIDMGRVTGVDISALNAFAQIRKICDDNNVLLLFSAVPERAHEKLVKMGAVGEANGRTLEFDEIDFALEFLEDWLLANSGIKTEGITIREFLDQMVDDKEKAELLLNALERVELPAGEVLFDQGDGDNGLYIVESGELSAFVRRGAIDSKRVRKFRPGSLIGEVSAYLDHKIRTAKVVTDKHSVLYHLNTVRLSRISDNSGDLFASIHELVATTLAERVRFMNARLLAEAE